MAAGRLRNAAFSNWPIYDGVGQNKPNAGRYRFCLEREGRQVAKPVNLSMKFEKLGGLSWQDILDLCASFVVVKARSCF
jgi:hypothetical protein